MKTSVCILILAAAIVMPRHARAERSEPIVPPPVPEGLELSPQEYTPFLVAHAVATQGDDPNCVAPDAVPWLLLEATVVADGPTGGDKMVKTDRIQRLNTAQGKAPATGAPYERTSGSGPSCPTRPTTTSTRRRVATRTTTSG